ncbi:MAG: hypothetical protein KGZ70_12115 [Hydrogenophaga sp.]|uniref:hypothetical protein n=1 Tax=Hydrogenophaga sp. TaxID=1904254 RepID=UPI001BC6A251|nr:hypothetical protein [Hydrogenophaga sp.]MBS3912540.1 hypothetical protein [Hydrogenophaga sp.]MDO9146476.1 hypothetical protein [Hydrogenophaga sp.]MDP2164383.1 hypothetical protein [Hydrogenophaga sp.]MDP3476371.1 hypothetical protein [Hydrogenophaga sp.]
MKTVRPRGFDVGSADPTGSPGSAASWGAITAGADAAAFITALGKQRYPQRAVAAPGA